MIISRPMPPAATSSATSPARMTIKPHDRKPTRASEDHLASEKAAEQTNAMHMYNNAQTTQ
jgi:hypothetical protein